MSNVKLPKVEILYEDADCVVVNKPAGLMMHPDGRSEGPFLTDWILEEYPMTKNVGEKAKSPDGTTLDRPGIVHRLDRETSGIVIVAKTKKGYESLKGQFKNRTITKKYLAFVWGELKEEFGTIDRPIGRSNDFPKWSAQRGARGELRSAETYWSKLESREWKAGNGKTEPITLIEAQPKTGRTHQIRVHFAAIQHPVVGDTLYAPKKSMGLGFKRLALHSWKIEFEDAKGKRVKVEAPLPKDFEKARKEMGIILK